MPEPDVEQTCSTLWSKAPHFRHDPIGHPHLYEEFMWKPNSFPTPLCALLDTPLCSMLFAAALLLVAPVAHATTYCLNEVNAADSGLDDATLRTFQQLLVQAVADNGHELLVPSASADTDLLPRCTVTVDLHLGRLGERIVANLTWEGGYSGAAQQFASSAEELDVVAAALATRLVTGLDDVRATRLGEVTVAAAAVDRRMDLRGGLAFGFGAHLPFAGTFNDALGGPSIHLGYFAEAREFGLQATTGFRWSNDPGNDGDGSMVMWGVDVAGVWLPSDGPFSPMLGGGVGLRWAESSRVEREVTGQAMEVEFRDRTLDSAWGMGTFLRAGLLLLRTYQVRLGIHMDVELNTMPQGDMAVQPAMNFGISMLF
jgi:hypothetical protein